MSTDDAGALEPAEPASGGDDVRLLTDLAEALAAQRAVPERFLEVGRAAFAWRDVDAELATLTFDSATNIGAAPGTRSDGLARLRAMTFTRPGLGLEVEVIDDGLVGQVVPPQPGTIELRRRGGQTNATEVDPVGWFAFRPRPVGTFRLRLYTAHGQELLTDWINL